MNPKIVIIDYGMGNLRSVQKGFEQVGFEARLTRSRREISGASAIVLPGVGAFKDCMENLEKYGLIEPILQSIEKGKPYLGICLGLQILLSESEEFGHKRGLDLIRGRVVKFRPDPEHKVPHMGWNTIEKEREAPPLQGLESGDFFYFVHSYYVVPEEGQWTSTVTRYGIPFVSSLWKENIFATQFHPEKSQQKGLKILENFAKSV
ncbi:MAG: imidazole glycerol phosphate synthase, glutamine amidotransferase subunit [Deltaproteobacteria bacterium RBG_16_49_23]|nr:MAG: imidazole glycerol phosphate synthase, glutamine amidotransferase subunit [Deltaproteobacteria bacterium RBG_16_49_23]